MEPIQNNVYEVVEGATSLCFADDGSWFQGNILPPKHCVYKIMGNRIDTVKETSTKATPSPADSGYASPPKNLEALNAEERQSYKSFSSTSSNSDSDLDPDLVQAVMDQWDLEDDSDFEDGENPPNVEFYRVTVADFETGINYRLNGVKVIRRNSECEIKSDKLKFKSEKCLKGALADQALVNQMGPSFADQNLTVFKGDVTFKYQDQVCNPVEVNESKWCL